MVVVEAVQNYKSDQKDNAYVTVSLAPVKWNEDKGQQRSGNL